MPNFDQIEMENKFTKFQNWFLETFSNVGSKAVNPREFDLLSQYIAGIGVEDWEVGYLTQNQKDFFLVLRDLPKVLLNNLKSRDSIVIISTDNVHIFSSMPKIEWGREVYLRGYSLKVDVSEWLFRVEKQSLETFVEVNALNLCQLEESERKNTIHTAMIREIGEALTKQICFSCVCEPDGSKNYIRIDELFDAVR